MSSRGTSDDYKLESLEKWRSSELERAQVRHAQTCAQTERREDAVAVVQQAIERSNDIAREVASENKVIFADALTRVRHYTAVQGDELKRAQTSLEEARKEMAQTHEALLKKLEDLSVVERLRKRRGAQADKELLRREQRRLDDQALLRLAQTTHVRNESEG